MGYEQKGRRIVKLTTHRMVVVLLTIFMILVVAGRVQADTELKFEKASFIENKGEQIGNAIEVRENHIYVAGIDTDSGSKSILAGYVPPANAPIWSFRWSDEKGPTPFTSVVFNDVATTDEGLYFVGYGLSDSKGKKYSTSLLVKFPLDPSAGPKVGTPIWVARPEFFPAFKQEAFQSVIAVKELGSTFIYATGYASSADNNSTALLAKYDADGKLVWFKTLSDTSAFKKSGGTALAALNSFIYVSGYSGSGKKKDKFEDYPLDAQLWKYDSSGQQIFEQKFKTKLYPLKSSMGEMKLDMIASGNHLYIVGSQKGAGGKGKGGDALLLKCDENGTLIWEMKRSADSESESHWYGLVTAIAAGSDRLYVVGHTEDVGKEESKKNEDAFLLEVDKEYGTVLATHSYGDSKNNEAALGVQVVGTDVYVVGLRRQQATGDSDLMLLRYSPLPGIEVKIDIQPDDSDNVIVQELKKGKDDAEDGKNIKKGKIAVVIFSTPKLNLLSEVKHGSLTFGRTGNENTWQSCSVKDMNGDGLVDYLCHFKAPWSAGDNSWPAFRVGDAKGILKGQTNSGSRLLGTDLVRIKSSDSEFTVSNTAQMTTATGPALTTLVSQPLLTKPAPSPAPAPTTSTTTSASASPTTMISIAPLASSPTSLPTPTTSTAPIIEPQPSPPTTLTSTVPLAFSTTQPQPSLTPLAYTEPRLIEPMLSTSSPTVSTAALTAPTLTTTTKTSYPTTNPLMSKEKGKNVAKPKERAPWLEDLGKEAFSKGNFARAIDYYKEALQLDPRSPELHQDLGLALFKGGRLEEAVEHFTEALKLDPGNTSARENLEMVLAKQKELKLKSTPTPATN